MNDLDQKLRDYYQSQSLSESKVAEILNAGKIVRPSFWRQSRWIAIAAVIVLFLGMITVMVRQFQPSLETIVAAEVFKNHSKQLAPEVRSADFVEIQTALSKLDFPIAPTQPEFLAGLTVQGGRYCSIQQELAAQVSLLDSEDSHCTLYIAPLTETLSHVDPGLYLSGEGTVQIWHDRHRLFALVR